MLCTSYPHIDLFTECIVLARMGRLRPEPYVNLAHAPLGQEERLASVEILQEWQIARRIWHGVASTRAGLTPHHDVVCAGRYA